MNVQIPLNRLIAAFVIGIGWVMTSFIAVQFASSSFGGSVFLILFFLFLAGCAATYGILSVLQSLEANSNQSRVDRMLSQLDERDLDALRSRLGAQRNHYDDDGEYDSLEALLDQQKRKRN